MSRGFKIVLGILVIFFGISLIMLFYDNPVVWLVPLAGLLYLTILHKDKFINLPESDIFNPREKILKAIVDVIIVLGLVFSIPVIIYALLNIGSNSLFGEYGIFYLYTLFGGIGLIIIGLLIYFFYRRDLLLAKIGIVDLIIVALLLYESLGGVYSLLLIIGLLAVLMRKYLGYWYVLIPIASFYLYFLIIFHYL